jgi:DNA-binding transcriptional regulator YiaG
MKSAAAERAWLVSEIGKRSSPSAKLRAEVHHAAVEYVQRRVAEGVSQSKLSQELGVTPTTVSRWMSSAKSLATERTKLRRVRVVVARRDERGKFVLQTPSGMRVEVASLEDVVALVRALG